MSIGWNGGASLCALCVGDAGVHQCVHACVSVSVWPCPSCVECVASVGAQTSCVAVRVRAGASAAEVAAKGGIEAVVAVLRRHEGVAAVAQEGCWALRHIAWLGVCSAAQQWGVVRKERGQRREREGHERKLGWNP